MPGDAVAEVLVDHRVLPSPRGVATCTAKSKPSPSGRRDSASRRWASPKPAAPGWGSPTSRLRPPSTYAIESTPPSTSARLREDPAGGGVEDRDAAGALGAQAGGDVLLTRGMPGAAGRPDVPGDRRAHGRRRVAGDGVDEPDPSRVPVEPAVGHLLPVRGELGVHELPRSRRPGSSAAGRCPASTGPRCAASSRRHRCRPGRPSGLKSTPHGACGVPPFHRPTGGDVPDDELTVAGDRPHQRAVGREPDAADLVPVSPQRADRRAVGGTHQEHLPPLVRRRAGGDGEQGPLGVHVDRRERTDVLAPPDLRARRHVVRRQRPVRVEGPAVRAERHSRDVGQWAPGRAAWTGSGGPRPPRSPGPCWHPAVGQSTVVHGGGQVATVGAEGDVVPPHRLAAGEVRASSSAAWCPGPAGAPARWTSARTG